MSGDDHTGHAHAVKDDADSKRLGIALGLIVAFMAVEVVVGIVAHSLALLSDAAHMLTDAGALTMSLVVIRLVRRPAGGNLTFGLKRAEILSAHANGGTLLVLAALIVYEGIHRLLYPPPAGGVAILVVALIGIAVNLAATWQLSKANRESMNVEGSFQHILTDLIAFIATAIAGAVIIVTGFGRADGIAALFVAAVMLYAAYGLLKDSGRVLLEAAPEGMSVEENRSRDRRTRTRQQPARPPRLGGRIRSSVPVRSRPGAAGRRLPWDPARARGAPRRALRHHAHLLAG